MDETGGQRAWESQTEIALAWRFTLVSFSFYASLEMEWQKDAMEHPHQHLVNS